MNGVTARRRRWSIGSTPLLVAALIGYCLFLAWVVLWPSAAPATRTVAHTTGVLAHAGAPSQIAQPTRVEFLLNVVMVVPVPLLATLLWTRRSWADWTALGFVISCGVELFQGLFFPDRSAQMRDVVSNTLGSSVGGALGLLAKTTCRRICAISAGRRNSAE